MTTPWRALASRARRSERGSTIVEAAIIIPLLCLLTFGSIEYGLAFRDSASVAASTRAGARVAAAMPGIAGDQTATPPQDGFQDAARKAVNSAISDLTHSVPVELVIYKADPTTGVPFGQPANNPNYDACTQCYRYAWDTASKSFTATTLNASGSYWTAGPLSDTSSQSYDICHGVTDAIGIYIKATHSFLTGLFGASQTYDHVTVMRLEPAGSDLCQ